MRCNRRWTNGSNTKDNAETITEHFIQNITTRNYLAMQQQVDLRKIQKQEVQI